MNPATKHIRETLEPIIDPQNEIYSSAMLLKDFPDLGRIVPEFSNPIIKELIHGKYRIVYKKISSDKIEIITVHHSAKQLNEIK